MRTETRLECATFELDEARTRCELWISTGNETEKLASGSFKPFIAHLKEAQDQIARGQSSIKLQVPSGRALWFTKASMQRFVTFVTKPHVLERVSIVETERCQLEQAIHILAGASHHAGENQTRETTGGAFAIGDLEDANDSDTDEDHSKNQLLVALDARRVSLQRKQLNAFTRAAAAGFDVGCMADMVCFADCFGAARLREACLKFASLYKKMQDEHQLTEPEGDKCSETAGENADCKAVATRVMMPKRARVLLRRRRARGKKTRQSSEEMGRMVTVNLVSDEKESSTYIFNKMKTCFRDVINRFCTEHNLKQEETSFFEGYLQLPVFGSERLRDFYDDVLQVFVGTRGRELPPDQYYVDFRSMEKNEFEQCYHCGSFPRLPLKEELYKMAKEVRSGCTYYFQPTPGVLVPLGEEDVGPLETEQLLMDQESGYPFNQLVVRCCSLEYNYFYTYVCVVTS